jgi:hypothetical protein
MSDYETTKNAVIEYKDLYKRYATEEEIIKLESIQNQICKENN